MKATLLIVCLALLVVSLCPPSARADHFYCYAQNANTVYYNYEPADTGRILVTARGPLDSLTQRPVS